MQPLPPSSGPTARGRFWAISLGIAFSGVATWYLLRDYELVKRLDDPERPEKRAFKVSFKPAEPLRLKPEVEAASKKGQA